MTSSESNGEGILQKVEDVAGGLLGRAGAAMTTGAKAFVESAAISDLYEIGSSTLALTRSSSEQVRSAARLMIDDHRETTRRLLGIVGRDPGLQPPRTMDSRRATMMRHLIQAGGDFDSAYLDQQVMAHQEAVTLMHGYRDHGDDAALRQFAAEVSPIIERHLDHMKQLKSGASA